MLSHFRIQTKSRCTKSLSALLSSSSSTSGTAGLMMLCLHRGISFLSSSRCARRLNVHTHNNSGRSIKNTFSPLHASKKQQQHRQQYSTSSLSIGRHFGLDAIFKFSSHRNFHCSGTAARSVNAGKESSGHKIQFELVERDATLLLHRGDSDESMRRLPLVWLRDHCRCPACYNHSTHQKDNVTSNLLEPESGKLDVSRLSLQADGNTLDIQWKDGHESQYKVEWLLSNSYADDNSRTPPALARRVLWTGDTIRESGGPPSVSYTSHVDTEEGLRQTLRNLLDYGFAMITDAPASLEGTKIVTDRVAPVQETFFGGLWQFTSDGSFSDTAYSSGYLSAHTDTTYLEMPAGFTDGWTGASPLDHIPMFARVYGPIVESIQVFQCLGHDGQGGETLLVDGFRAVDVLRQTHPKAFRCLSTHMVPHEYKESPGSAQGSPGYHMYTVCPVIKLNPATGDLFYLRFNPYDRAPLNTIPPEQMTEFYQSYHLLSTVIANPEGEFWVKLTPGTILLIDNWRVMHGRSAFDGKRVMCGCYLRRDDWMSKVRVMGL